MQRFFEFSTAAFDPIHQFWESQNVKRTVAVVQILTFLLGLLFIELNLRGLLPEVIARITPLHHAYAINLAFTLVLVQEVIDLIFALPCSVSKSLSKQFEILSLILLRNSFKELVNMNEPISLSGGMESLLPLLSDGLGALIVFIGIGYFNLLQSKRPQTKRGPTLFQFVSLKKFLALILLAIFFGLGADVIIETLQSGEPKQFWGVFYTILIFSDILIILISHVYQPSYKSVFRNSGFALCTLLIRLALAAPPVIAPLVAVCSIAMALLLAFAHQKFVQDKYPA